MPPKPAQAFRFSAINPGVFGNLIYILIEYDEGGADLIIDVAGTKITLTVGITGGDTTNIDWIAIAALINADPDASALVLAEGPATPRTDLISGGEGPLRDGFAGKGEGQFYSGSASPPPPGGGLVGSCPVNNQALLGQPFTAQLIVSEIPT